MEITYKVIDRYQKKDKIFVIIHSITMVLVCVIMVLIKGMQSLGIAIGICVLFTLFQLIPFERLNRNYHSQNDGDELVCDFEKGSFTYSHLGEIVKFNSNDIKAVKRYMSYYAKNTGSQRTNRILGDNYNYSDIELKDGRRLIITSLLVPDMNKFIDDLRIENNTINKIGGWYSFVRERFED